MKILLWIPKIIVLRSLVGVGLTAIGLLTLALLLNNPELLIDSESVSLPRTENAAPILLVMGLVYIVTSICYSDSIEPMSEGIANLSAFVGVSGLVSSVLYFQGHDVLRIIANHNLTQGGRQSLPVFEGLATIAPWWLLGTMIAGGMLAFANDRTEAIGRVAVFVGGAYLCLKVIVPMM